MSSLSSDEVIIESELSAAHAAAHAVGQYELDEAVVAQIRHSYAADVSTGAQLSARADARTGAPARERPYGSEPVMSKKASRMARGAADASAEPPADRAGGYSSAPAKKKKTKSYKAADAPTGQPRGGGGGDHRQAVVRQAAGRAAPG